MSAPCVCIVCGEPGRPVFYRDDFAACRVHEPEVYETAVALNDLACAWVERNEAAVAERWKLRAGKRVGEALS